MLLLAGYAALGGRGRGRELPQGRLQHAGVGAGGGPGGAAGWDSEASWAGGGPGKGQRGLLDGQQQNEGQGGEQGQGELL